MAKLMSMNAVNRINVAVKKLQELILALDTYDDSVFIVEVDKMIKQLKNKLK